MLAGPGALLVVDNLVGIFRNVFVAHWGPRTDDVLRAACLTLSLADPEDDPAALANRQLARLAGKLDYCALLARAVGHPTWVLFACPSFGRQRTARRVLAHSQVLVATAVIGAQPTPDGPWWQAVGGTTAHHAGSPNWATPATSTRP